MPEAIPGDSDTIIPSSKCPEAHFEHVTGHDHLCESPCNTTDVALDEPDATHPDPRMFLRQMSAPAALYNVGDGDNVFWFRDWEHINATEVRSLADPDMDIDPEEARAVPPTLKLGVAAHPLGLGALQVRHAPLPDEQARMGTRAAQHAPRVHRATLGGLGARRRRAALPPLRPAARVDKSDAAQAPARRRTPWGPARPRDLHRRWP